MSDKSLADNLRDKVLAVIVEYNEAARRDRVHPQEAAYGLTRFAELYAKAKSYAERDDLAEQFGGSLSLAEAGLIRRIAKALEGALPDLIVEAHIGGMSAPQIARELACSDRHAYQVIKDNPWEAQWVAYRAMWLPDGDYTWKMVDSGTVETTESALYIATDICDQLLEDDDLARSGVRANVWRAGDEDDFDETRAFVEREGERSLAI